MLAVSESIGSGQTGVGGAGGAGGAVGEMGMSVEVGEGVALTMAEAPPEMMGKNSVRVSGVAGEAAGGTRRVMTG